MPGITHLEEMQQPALRELVVLTEEDADLTFADRFLPTETTFNRKFAYDIVKTNNYIAGYIGYGSEPPVMDRNAVADKAGELAMFGLQDIATYEEIQALYEARNDDEQEAAIDSLTNKAIDILNGMRRLIYVAKMEALFKGRHEYTDKQKNKIIYDFGVPAANKVALTAGNDFESAGFDIIGFLEGEVEKYRDENGRDPEAMYGSAAVRSLMQRNAGIIAEAGKAEGATRVSVEELNEVLANFELPPFVTIKERSVTVKQNGTNEIVKLDLVPNNRITFLSEGVGQYLLGPTLENDFRPGLYVNAKDKEDPIMSIIEGYGAGFPAPEVPSLIAHLDVFTPA